MLRSAGSGSRQNRFLLDFEKIFDYNIIEEVKKKRKKGLCELVIYYNIHCYIIILYRSFYGSGRDLFPSADPMLYLFYCRSIFHLLLLQIYYVFLGVQLR